MSMGIEKAIETFRLLMQVKLSSKDGDIKRECRELGLYDRYLQIVGRYFEIGSAKARLSDRNLDVLRERCTKVPHLIFKGRFYHWIDLYRTGTTGFDGLLIKEGLSEKGLKMLLKGDLMAVDMTALKILQKVTGEDIRSLASIYADDIAGLLRNEGILTKDQKHVKEIKRLAADRKKENAKKATTTEDLEGLLKRSGLTAEAISKGTDLDVETVASWFTGWISGIGDHRMLVKLMPVFGLENINELKVRVKNSEDKIVGLNKSIDTLNCLLRLAILYEGRSLEDIFKEVLRMSHSTPYRWLQERNLASVRGYMSKETEKKIKAVIGKEAGYGYPKIPSRLDDLTDGYDPVLLTKKGDLVNMTKEDLRKIARRHGMSPLEIGALYQREVRDYLRRTHTSKDRPV